MATILVKNLPEGTLKELKRLKVELECKTWAELLAKLVESEKAICLREEEVEQMKAGVKGFLSLGEVVSRRWSGSPTVLEEFGGSRHSGPC